MNIIVIAIATAVIWSGVIIYLLLRMMSEQGQIEGQIDKLEGEIGGAEKDDTLKH